MKPTGPLFPPRRLSGITAGYSTLKMSYRMSKSDLKARPIYARKQNSITAHLNIVMAALAVTHLMETRSGHFIKRLVRTLKKYRSFQLVVGGETIHAAVPLPPEIQTLVNTITTPTLRH